MQSKLIFLFVVGVLFVTSCSKDDNTQADCSGVTPTYNAEIVGIMNASCAYANCHDSGTRSGGIDLSSYAKVKAASANDNFLKSIKHQSGAEAMPQGSDKLADDVILKIECWIQNGWPQ